MTDRHDALPATRAGVILLHAGNVVSTTTTDSGGRYVFTGVPIGIYAVQITARGYSSTLNSDLALTSGSALTLDASPERATASRTGVREIGKNSASSLTDFAAATTTTRDNAIARVSSNVISFTGVTRAH